MRLAVLAARDGGDAELAGLRDLVRVVAEDDELTREPRLLGVRALRQVEELAEVPDRAVARAVQAAGRVAHEALEHLGPDVVEVDAVVRAQLGLALERAPQDLAQVGVQEDRAVVEELDVLDPGIGVEAAAEVVDPKGPPPTRG